MYINYVNVGDKIIHETIYNFNKKRKKTAFSLSPDGLKKAARKGGCQVI